MKAEADRADQAGAEDTERNSVEAAACAEAEVATRTRTKAEAATASLMEAVVERGNLMLAYQRVVENKGAAGVDQLAVSRAQRPSEATLADDTDQTAGGRLSTATGAPGGHTQAARRGTDTGHSDGGGSADPAGVASGAATDLRADLLGGELRLSAGRNAHQALRQARQYVAQGKRWVVDMDLEKFFDRVNHDLLMSKLATKIDDARVLKLIRRYLEAGMMADGLVSRGQRARRKAGRCRRCCPTSCSLRWTGNWNDEATPSAVTPTTATSMSPANGRAWGCCTV